MTPKEAFEALQKYGSRRAAAKATGVPRTTLRRLVKRYDGNQNINSEIEGCDERLETKWHSDGSLSIVVQGQSIKTKEDALAYAGMSEDEWEIKECQVTSWSTPMKVKVDDEQQPVKIYNFRVAIKARPRAKPDVQEAITSILERLEANEIYHPPMNVPEYNEPHLLEISLYDHHFGLLAWRREVGEDYDLKYAEYLYLEAVKGLLSKVRGYEIDEILFPVGQDFFHINDPSNTTPQNKNRLDVDGRLAKVFEVGFMAVIQAVRMCRNIAPVIIKWVPGNHDPQTSYFLCQSIKSWFRQADNVMVDVEPTPRKYHHYGVNLVGMTHSDSEPLRELPNVMANECREIWGQVHHCEWHIGHKHSRKEVRYMAAESLGDMVVRRLPSLCGRDYWHFTHGYQSERAAEAYLFSKNDGYAGHFAISAREILTNTKGDKNVK